MRNKVLKKASQGVGGSGEVDEATLLKLKGSIEKQQKKREANAINHAYRLAGRCVQLVPPARSITLPRHLDPV